MRRIPLQPPHDRFTLDGPPTVGQVSKHRQWAASILSDDGCVNICLMLCVGEEEIGVSFNEGWSYMPLSMIKSCDWQAMDPETNLPIAV